MEIFGSYLDKDRSLFGEAVSITALDTFVALTAGLIVIPSCFAYDVEPGAGPGLVFITLPNIFNSMPGGRFWGTLFFIFLSFAAISTVIAVFENIIGFCMDLWDMSRQKAVVINLFVVIIGSMPCVLGFNALSGLHPFGPESNIMDLEDFIVSNNLLPLGSLVFVLFCCSRYGWGWKNFVEEVNAGKGMRFPLGKAYMMFVLPVIILIVYVKGCLDFFKGQEMSTTFGVVYIVIVLAIFAYIIFGRKKGTVPTEPKL
jgi:NSS family neurotransmitter:Na+ symporter